MNSMEPWTMLGRWLVIIGITLAVIGGIVWLVGKTSALKNLPGTLRFDFAGGSCIIPLLASIVLSVVLTLVLNLVVKLLNR